MTTSNAQPSHEAAALRADVCVIGSGIVGQIGALQLAKRGLSVVIVDELTKRRVATYKVGESALGYTTAFLRGIGELDKEPSLGVGIEAVTPVLQFIEEHREVDFGTPGPLVHFVERFYGNGYEEQLLESLARQPRALTVWMLNRIINGTTSPEVRQRLIGVMRQVGGNPQADQDTRQMAARFLERVPG